MLQATAVEHYSHVAPAAVCTGTATMREAVGSTDLYSYRDTTTCVQQLQEYHITEAAELVVLVYCKSSGRMLR